MVDWMGRMLNWLLARTSAAAGKGAKEPGRLVLDPGMLKRMAREIAHTDEHEIGCEECFRLLDQFVDMTLAGRNAAEAMPLVQGHLDRCDECREEFEALLAALRGLS